MSAGVLAAALTQLLLIVVVGWALGNLILDRCLREEPAGRLGPPERALAAVAGLILFCVGLMALHIVTGGAVFGLAGVVPGIALATTVLCRRHLTLGGPIPVGKLALAVALLAALYLAPALIGGSSIRTGDPPWHLGWTAQLLAGEPVPTGPAPEFGRNAYPWGLHAVMATAVRLLPGSSALTALEMLHILIVFTIPLAAGCLARRIRTDAGWAAAAAASLIGGFGWIVARGPDFVTSPSRARYGADLVVASPNSVYELFPPALPRELGLVMLAAAAWLALSASRMGRHNGWVAAGAASGLVGLLSVPLFVTALLWQAGIAVTVPRGRRLRWFATTSLSALAIFALWAGPVVSQVVRHGGFVNITPQLGMEWPVLVALASWGLLLPLALAGAVHSVRARVGRPLVVAAVLSVSLLVVAVARGHFGWDLAGNATLLHQGRVWPPAHLLGAVFGGVGLVWCFESIRRRSKAVALTGVALLLAVGAISPALAARSLTGTIARGGAGFEYGTDDMGSSDSFVRRAARYLGPGHVVDVRGNDKLAFVLFQLSGVTLAGYDDPRLEGNDLRIRYEDLAAAYDKRMDAGGFPADFLVIPAPDGPYDRALVRGPFQGSDWILMQLDE